MSVKEILIPKPRLYNADMCCRYTTSYVTMG